MKKGWNLEYKYNNKVAILVINRTKFMNALNIKLLEEMDLLLTKIENYSDIRVLIITGSGEKSFVAGADIDQLGNLNPSESKYLIEIGHKTFSHIEQFRIPVISAINGYTLGGGLELALSTDIRVCSKNAKFGFPEVKLGLIPGWGGPYRLARLIGESRAKDLVFRGKLINSKEALNYGLVTEVFENVGELMKNSLSLAKEIADKSPIVISYDKKIITDNRINPLQDALALAYCINTKDAKEGIRAFVEKRKPKFVGE